MKRIILIFVFLGLNHLIDWGPFNLMVTFGQGTTTVTGTITDSNGNAYANGTASAFKSVASGQPTATPVNVTTNASGFFTMTLASPASYQFTICASPVLLGQPTVNPTPKQICFISAPIAISGASQDVSATLNAIAPLLGPQGQGTNPNFVNPTVTGTLTVSGNTNGECAVTSTASLSAANLVCTTSSTKIHIWPGAGTYSGTGLTINAQLQVDAGSLISGTPTINGYILAGIYPIFASGAAPVLGPIPATEVWADWFTAASYGASITAANAAVVSGGSNASGTIRLSGGSYTISSTITVGGVVGKIVNLRGAGENATILTSSVTAAPTFIFSGGQGNQSCTDVSGFTLYGPGNSNASSIAIQFAGNSVGCSGPTLRNLVIGASSGATLGFGTGINWNESSGVSYLTMDLNTKVQGNVVGVALAGEGNSVAGGLIANNQTGVTCASGGQHYLNQVSLDDNTVTGASLTHTGCRVTFEAVHFENAGGGTDLYLTMTAGVAIFQGADGFQNDCVNNSPVGCNANSSAQMANVSGSSLIVYEAPICSASWTNPSMTQMFNLSANTVNAVLHPKIVSNAACSTTSVSPIFNSAFAGLVDAYTLIQGNNTPAWTMQGSGPGITLKDVTSGGTWGINVNTATGRMNFLNAGAARFSFDNNGFFPVSDNFEPLGFQTNRWQTVWGLGYGIANIFASGTAPTIAAAGCGGAAAAITAPNGTASFEVSVGTTPGSACTITMPAATTSWTCDANTVSATTTTNFYVKQTGALSTTSVVLTLFSDVAAATAFQGSDTLRVKCSAN